MPRPKAMMELVIFAFPMIVAALIFYTRSSTSAVDLPSSLKKKPKPKSGMGRRKNAPKVLTSKREANNKKAIAATRLLLQRFIETKDAHARYRRLLSCEIASDDPRKKTIEVTLKVRANIKGDYPKHERVLKKKKGLAVELGIFGKEGWAEVRLVIYYRKLDDKSWKRLVGRALHQLSLVEKRENKLRCPFCQEPLDERSQCLSHGRLLMPEDTETYLNEQGLSKSEFLAAAKASELSCPNCKMTMRKRNAENVEIDICRGCGCVWLDPHEALVVDRLLFEADRV